MDYGKLLSDRAKTIPPSGIRRFFEIAESMRDCISLGVGEPDFKTPWNIRQAGIKALQEGKTRYTANAGTKELRAAVAEYLQNRFSLCYDPESQIVITVGGSEGIDLAMRALVNPGDEVLIPEPSFVCYRPLAELAGGKAVAVPTCEEDRFVLTPETLQNAITPKTKILVLPYPNNPTGAVMTRAEYEKIAQVLKNTQITVLSDEIYIELTYPKGRTCSFAEIGGMQERTVLINGFSKTYAMTGWRLGYVCAPAPVAAQIVKLHQYQIMSAPTVSQHAAVEALRQGTGSIQEMREEYNMRRLYLLDRFRQLEIPCFEPHGAFYVFPNIRKYGLSSEEFCEKFLREYHVAVVPGSAFGTSGEGHVRISYAYSLQHLKKAMDRLEEFDAKYKGVL